MATVGPDLAQPAASAVRPPAATALEHLSGRERGRVSWLTEATEQVDVRGGVSVLITEPTSIGGSQAYLRLHRAGDTYELEVLDGRRVWVNGERADSHRLTTGDLIELGEGGPLLRFRVYPNGTRMSKTVAEIFSDCVDSVRTRRSPPWSLALAFLGAMFRDLATRTTLLFRAGVIAALATLAGYAFVIGQSNVELRQRIVDEASRLESFAEALVRSQSEELREGDLARLREEIGSTLVRTSERVSALEERSTAGARIIATASQSIVFIQGAYGFWNPDSGRKLRYVVDDDGNRLVSPVGRPLLTIEGDGPVAERQFVGTAFAVSAGGILLTNRHVALPWENDAAVALLAEQDLEPLMLRFIAYLPGIEAPFEASMLKASDEADLAVLGIGDTSASIPFLELAEEPPRPGEEILVMGFPTGLKSMLAQTGEQFVEELRQDEETDFWKVARRLSRASYIRPLASRGIVGQIAPAAVIYDAETTHGGSGGPVLDLQGRVVAVNTAIIPEFGGSNIGIPAQFARRLLDESGVTAR